VRLGTGSRLVCLMGPPDAEEPMAARGGAAPVSAARQAARAQRLSSTTGISGVSAEDLHGVGAGWGFTEDAAAEAREEKEEEELERHGLDALLAMLRKSELRLSARQQRLLEQIEKRSEKLAHIAQESGRISAKVCIWGWKGALPGNGAHEGCGVLGGVVALHQLCPRKVSGPASASLPF
jgi:hypothetical protein